MMKMRNLIIIFVIITISNIGLGATSPHLSIIPKKNLYVITLFDNNLQSEDLTKSLAAGSDIRLLLIYKQCTNVIYVSRSTNKLSAAEKNPAYIYKDASNFKIYFRKDLKQIESIFKKMIESRDVKDIEKNMEIQILDFKTEKVLFKSKVNCNEAVFKPFAKIVMDSIWTKIVFNPLGYNMDNKASFLSFTVKDFNIKSSSLLAFSFNSELLHYYNIKTELSAAANLVLNTYCGKYGDVFWRFALGGKIDYKHDSAAIETDDWNGFLDTKAYFFANIRPWLKLKVDNIFNYYNKDNYSYTPDIAVLIRLWDWFFLDAVFSAELGSKNGEDFKKSYISITLSTQSKLVKKLDKIFPFLRDSFFINFKQGLTSDDKDTIFSTGYANKF